MELASGLGGGREGHDMHSGEGQIHWHCSTIKLDLLLVAVDSFRLLAYGSHLKSR